VKAVAVTLGIFALATFASPADATTCRQRAANCVRLGGSPGNCSEPSRMASCKQSGVYTAPSGRTWEAKNR
jgi:hypothetical protein